MEEIIAYKLSNGVIIENKEEAEKLEKQLTFERNLRRFVDEQGFYSGLASNIYEAINDNREVLREMLNELPK